MKKLAYGIIISLTLTLILSCEREELPLPSSKSPKKNYQQTENQSQTKPEKMLLNAEDRIPIGENQMEIYLEPLIKNKNPESQSDFSYTPENKVPKKKIYRKTTQEANIEKLHTFFMDQPQ